jgi:hypothetical protein
LSRVRDGDIVLVDGEPAFYAVVLNRLEGRHRVRVRPTSGNFPPREARGSELIGLWRRCA